MIRLSILCALVACFGVSRQPQKGSDTPYNMAKPSAVLQLPMALREVSALTDVDSLTVACVEDEQATVHFLSLQDGRIVGSFPFHGPADMEGLTRVGGTFYALRSDGLLYHLGGVEQGLSILDTVHLQVANRNIEGLGYDEKQHRILVSPKDVLNDGSATKDERVVYGVDPEKLNEAPVVALRLSMRALTAAAEKKGIALPMKRKKNGEVVSGFKLRYSSVAMHPFTDHFYLLSAVDRTLLVVDRKGELVDLLLLDPVLLPKPEGITFMPNGDMLLSSEGKGSAPVLVRYAYRP